MATVADTIEVRLRAAAGDFNREIENAFGARSPLARIGTVAAGAAAAAGAALVGLAAKGLSEFEQFETDMAVIFRKLPPQSAEMEQAMVDGIKRMAGEYGVSVGEITSGMADFVAAIDDVPDSLDFMESAIRTSISTGEELGTVVERLDGVFNGFKTEGYEVAEVADIMAAAADFGAANFDQLGQGLAKIVTPALESGASLEEVTAALTTLTNFNIQAAEGGTMVRNMLNELNDSSKGVGETFKELTGTAFPEFIANGGSLEEALNLLARAAEESGMDLSTLFTSVLSGQAAFLLTGPGAEEFAGALEAVGNSAGYVDAGYERMAATIRSKKGELQANLQALMLDLGEKLAPAFIKVLDATNASFPVIKDVVLGVFDAVSAGTEALQGVWEAFRGFVDRNWDTISGITEAAGHAIEKVFELLVMAWEGILKPAWDAIVPHLEPLWKHVVGIIQAAWNAINGIFDVIIGFLTGDWERAWAGMEMLIDSVHSAVQHVIGAAWTTIQAVWDTIVAVLGGVFTTAWEYWRDAVASVWADVTTAIQNAWSVILELLTNLADFITTPFINAWDDMTAGITAAWDATTEGVNTAWEAIKGTLETVMEFISGVFTNAWTALSDSLSSVWDTISTNMHAAWANITGDLAHVWNNIAGIAATLWSAVVDAVLGVFDRLAETLRGVWNGVVDTVIEAVNTAISLVNGLLDKWNSISFTVPRVDFPAIEAFGKTLMPGFSVGGQTVSVPQIPTIPMLAEGGIVHDPTLAMIGEAGSEAVIPLDQLDHHVGGGGSQTIIVELDGRRIMEAMAPRMVDALRVRTGIRGI